MKKNFLISTGGSGGHVTPAKILYEHLSDETNIIVSTDKRGLKYLDENVYQHEVINTPKLSNLFFLPINIIVIIYLIIKSIFLLRKKKIKKVFSTGGYMSLPIILAARLINSKIYLIEPNHVLGRANKFFLNFSEKIFCYSSNLKNFPKKFNHKMVVINPLVNKLIYELKPFDQKKDKFTLLIVGGSQGANFFDKNLKDSIVNISKTFPIKVLQQTSEENLSFLKDYYSNNNIENKIFTFEKNLPDLIQQSDICITRSGASTLAELSVLNLPFIAVPLPSSKDNHQFENACFYKNNDCCWLIEQRYFEEKIEDFLKNILTNQSEYLKKKENLKKLNYQNSWFNVNQKILKVINEN